MLLQCEAPPVDDSWRDEPLCSVDALPDPEFSHLTAVASMTEVSQESVTDPQSTTTPANGCTTPILPWTSDQARPTTPTTARRVAVGQQQTIDVLRSPSKRRRDAATGVTEEDVTAMAFVASMQACLRIVASND